jgi:hypothetical protein
VIDPIPASVADIKVDEPKYGNYTGVFRFVVDREDFQSIRSSRPFRDIGFDANTDVGLSWFWGHEDARSTRFETGYVIGPYARQSKPSWYDLPEWQEPEGYALEQRNADGSMELDVLVYNADLGAATFITYYNDGRGL